MRGLAKRQKDRLEKEIQELQAELQELQDKHFDEVRESNFLPYISSNLFLRVYQISIAKFHISISFIRICKVI